MKELYQSYVLGDMWAAYLYDSDKNVMGMTLLPAALREKFTLEGSWNIEAAVQLKIIGDRYPDGFAHGHTMRNSVSVRELCFREQFCQEGEVLRVVTVMDRGELEVRHVLEYEQGKEYLYLYTELIHHGSAPLGIEMVSSFNLCGFSSLEEKERMEELVLHRMQSKWSQEGKLLSQGFLELQLEPSWMRSGVNSIRFGQVGSMPVRRYFPWMIAEDIRYGYSIGVQLMHPASWQMEVYNKDDRVSLSGGLADREFGHWHKYLEPEEVFVTPRSILTTAGEDVDGISYRLTCAQKKNLEKVPEIEKELPVVFNEFCTTWGAPGEENIGRIVETIKGKGITYCVIDAGWYAINTGDWTNIGDWIPNPGQFPNGLLPAANAIRDGGMVPGIWFEMELAGMKSAMFEKEDYLLKRDGYPVQTGCRRFLDMRREKVVEYLAEKVIGTLKDCGFGYMKVDYNDNIGIGCDGAESLGEGLRQNMECSQKFFRRIRSEIPDLVIENCSSGGHRLEPSMQELCSMASFSDAHECKEIPVIAANAARAILPAQSQIWAVMRKKDDESRVYYSCANTFLGRMCLSGDVYDLEDWQWGIIEEAIGFYQKCAPLIKDGRNYRYGPQIRSYNHLKGWQAVCRKGSEGERIMAVVHSFEEYPETIAVKLPIESESARQSGKSLWRVADGFHKPGIACEIEEGCLIITGMKEFDAGVWLIESGS